MDLTRPPIRLFHWMEEQPRLQPVTTVLRRLKHNLTLTLERRVWLVLLVDAFFIFVGSLEALVEGAGMDRILDRAVFLPSVLLLLPTLAGSVALERRAGSLDLALSAVSTERYFLRRLFSLSALFAAQGAFLIALSYMETAGSDVLTWNRYTLPFLRAEFQNLMLHAFLACQVLFWCTRLRTSGGVWVMSLITVGLFAGRLKVRSTWSVGFGDVVFGLSLPMLNWIWSMAVVGLATTIFYLYARERLRRPETLLD